MKPAPPPIANPWPRIFIGVCGSLLVFLAFLMWREKHEVKPAGEWEAAMATHIRTATAPSAMEPILEAFAKTDWQYLSTNGALLEKAASSNWKGDGSLDLQRFAIPIQRISRSAEIEADDFPATASAGIDRPLPDVERITAFTFMLLANARQLLAAGHGDEAMHRLLELDAFAARFARPPEEASLASHLIAINGMDLAADAMLHVVQDSRPSTATLRLAEAQLDVIAARYHPVIGSIHSDADVYAKTIAEHSDSPDSLATALQFFDSKLTVVEAHALASSIFADAAAFPAENARVRRLIDAQLAMPLIDQKDHIDSAWAQKATENRLVQRGVSQPSAVTVREALMLARTRLLQLAIAARLRENRHDLLDPFSGKSFGTMRGGYYSIGPDCVDQQGAKIYNPTAGIYSAGDIAVY
ncbi:hypothetical protein BH09SUM1_BH09SUM1_24090 [soil metagenome]